MPGCPPLADEEHRLLLGQVPGPSGIVVYRMFRRDHAGALHFLGLNFYRRDTRRAMAIALRAACHRLHDRVDEIELQAMGVEA